MNAHDVKRLDAKASSKGQVTIPAEIRELIGLEPGGTVQFVTDGEGGVRLIAKRKDISHLFGFLGPAEQTLDIDEAIMDTVWERNRPDRTEFGI
jgi:antitoxin PrlF